MSKCSECEMLIEGECLAYLEALESLGRSLPPPPLGSCVIPIVKSYLQLIQPGMNVLEIGCGSWDAIERRCQDVGASYEGIDTQAEYFGKQTIATRLENLAHLSFEDNYFDLVIGNQTMEHWAENGCSLKWGLYQCFRVCKTNGRVLLNVPIHFHGTRTFMLGKLDELLELFAPFSNQTLFTKWGYPSLPLPSSFPYPGYWKLQNSPAYILDIQAVKDKPLPEGYHNMRAVRGKLAQVLNYPFSYNIYRVLRKTKLLSQT